MIFVIITSVVYKYVNKKVKLNINNIKRIDVIKLPVPPKKKVVTKKEDIVEIINFINSIQLLEEINDPVKGWIYTINIYNNSNNTNNTIEFLGDKINIYNKWYKINDNNLEKLRKIYKDLNYEQASFP
ncbi:Uncharacterised protein [Clostridium botulinum]|uniref:hypothetical protein n=1 Tax=Clostridium botulinum TaxID=1491 RepID=UPI000E05A294|nr:hypothetical protein [Clostridium sporogenes]STE73766.1 Uncharacterised protein [Clostridium botulinum]